MKTTYALALVLALVAPLQAAGPPNIVLCLADDWGWPHAGAYGDAAIQTPVFDRLAREGVLFEHAYVASPSCTPSRNALITGKYHWELGPGANLWSTLPLEHESFIHILRDHGYVTGRSKAKTWGPGNIEPWSEHHGDHPATGAFGDFADFLDKTGARQKPFFFWVGTSDPHRGYVEGSGAKSGIDPAKVHLYPHLPDADVVRNDIADYYFEVQRWDALVGSVVKQLEDEGLLENTIVIMTGDNGMPFPRGKSNLYDAGVRVPFAVRWGDSIRPGRVVEDFISFADVAPTLLEVGGIAVPPTMSGSSFAPLLTATASGRLDADGRPDVVFGKERHVPSQVVPDMGGYPCRGLRTMDWLYIRNYRPDRLPAGTGDFENANYPGQWFADCDAGPTKTYLYLNRDQDEAHRNAFALCFGPRPSEELYDLRKDPGQLHNLADHPAQAGQLEALRVRLEQRLRALHDPRADDPGYDGFDLYPYLGGGGGTVPKDVHAMDPGRTPSSDDQQTP